MFIAFIRKSRSYSRQVFNSGFDTTSVFYVTDTLHKIHEKRDVIGDPIEKKGGLGVNSRLYNRLERKTSQSFFADMD